MGKVTKVEEVQILRSGKKLIEVAGVMEVTIKKKITKGGHSFYMGE